MQNGHDLAARKGLRICG